MSKSKNSEINSKPGSQTFFNLYDQINKKVTQFHIALANDETKKANAILKELEELNRIQNTRRSI
ncbi:MAG: hypothetical protein ACOYJ1_05785 [Peptococcales bacterium]|jgi:uncharacterized protein YukE